MFVTGLLRRLPSVVAVALALSTTAAVAADAPPDAGVAAARTLKLALLGVTPGAGMTPEVAATVSQVVQSELVNLEVYAVTGPAEIQAVLGLERQKELLGCTTDSTCLAEVAGALDADRSVSGEIGKLGGSYLLNVSLVDPRSGQSLGRVSRRVKGEIDALLDEVGPAVAELASKDPALAGRTFSAPASEENEFVGLTVGVRTEADLARGLLWGGVQSELAGESFGGGVAVQVGSAVSVRTELRFYPLDSGRARPYVALGATFFTPSGGASASVSPRSVVGITLKFGAVRVFGDLAAEYHLTAAPGASPLGILAGMGAGYRF